MIEISESPDLPPRPIVQPMLRGWHQSCPACGEGALYRSYLKVADHCPNCGEELHHHRADDAPPYFTILIVGHVIIAGLLLLEKAYAPETWVHLSIWIPLTLVMCLWMLPRVKGLLIGLQWALRMHGFGGDEPRPADDMPPHPADPADA